MPSRERAPTAGRSLSTRVLIASVSAAAASALIAAMASLFVADGLVREAEDKRLREMAALSLRELAPFAGTPALAGQAAEEAAEFAPASIEIAVWQAGVFVGGNAQLPAIAGGRCESRPRGPATLRTCAVEGQGLSLSVGATHTSADLPMRVLACLVSVGIAAIVAAIAGRRAVGWALDPFLRLQEALSKVSPRHPDAATLPIDRRVREVGELRDTLADLFDRLAQALSAAHSFSAEAAHELSTPLTTIRAELELLEEEPLGENERAAVARLRQRSIALSALVDRLLLLATVGDGAITRRSVALEDVIRGAIAALTEPDAARVALDLRGQGMVHGDEALLRALVDNAIDNALKFSGDRGVEVRLRETREGVVLQVRDHGPGIGADLRGRVFEPFYRSPAARGANTHGHGLGLAIVARIAQAHEGSVSFTDVDDDDGGACLRLVLPSWGSIW